MPSDILRICHAVLTDHGGLLASLFIAGLAGSATHCVGMCAPFVISQTAVILDEKPLGKLSELTRLRGAALLPYHAGRMTTYALLGISAAFLAVPLRALPWFNEVSAIFLLGAGLLFMLSAFPSLVPDFFFAPVSFSPFFFRPFQYLFKHPRGLRGYVLGIFLGFLPCGLVYAALLSVAAHAQPLTAGLGMIVFALGTVPALIAVGIGGHFVLRRFGKIPRYVLSALMTLNGIALIMMAGELIK